MRWPWRASSALIQAPSTSRSAAWWSTWSWTAPRRNWRTWSAMRQTISETDIGFRFGYAAVSGQEARGPGREACPGPRLLRRSRAGDVLLDHAQPDWQDLTAEGFGGGADGHRSGGVVQLVELVGELDDGSTPDGGGERAVEHRLAPAACPAELLEAGAGQHAVAAQSTLDVVGSNLDQPLLGRFH